MKLAGDTRMALKRVGGEVGMNVIKIHRVHVTLASFISAWHS